MTMHAANCGFKIGANRGEGAGYGYVSAVARFPHSKQHIASPYFNFESSLWLQYLVSDEYKQHREYPLH
jgi:hypothetical protein